MKNENILNMLDEKTKKYEEIIEELKSLGASQGCISSVIQDYECICNLKFEIMRIR